MATDTRKLVRFMRRDLPGDVTLERSLTHLKGIGPSMARAIRMKSGLPKETRIGDLEQNKIELLIKLIENVSKQNFPPWLLNRRKDYTTGITTHLFEADLDFAQREDVQRMKRMRSYKGIRHIYGLKVRGQRTRSTGRTGGILGVVRKGTVAPAPKPAGTAGKPAAGKPAAPKKAEGAKK